MSEIFSRNELLWGKDFQDYLAKKHVVVIGIGGVGGYTLESLARAGVGSFTIVDFDTVSESNVNRQIIALNSTIGQKKTDLFEKRLKDINPDIKLTILDDFYSERLNDELFSIKPDFVVDAIDTMKSKVELLIYCVNKNLPVVSSMGAGNRFDPTQLYISDISMIENKKFTFLNNILRQLKKNGIEKGIFAVTSREKPLQVEKVISEEKIVGKDGTNFEFSKISPASCSTVPAVAGYLMAHVVLSEFLKLKNQSS